MSTKSLAPGHGRARAQDGVRVQEGARAQVARAQERDVCTKPEYSQWVDVFLVLKF